MLNPPRAQHAAWGLAELLDRYAELAIRPHTGSELLITGDFCFRARGNGAEIEDSYEIEMIVPGAFPRALPRVKETAGRIPSNFHHYPDGALCLGSPIRLCLMLGKRATLREFADRCLVPYLFAYSYKVKHGVLPFGELEHGGAGIVDDLRSFFAVESERKATQLLRLAGIQRRRANKPQCPCGSGYRVGRCHHRTLNRLRDRLGRASCRTLHQLLGEHRLRTKQQSLARL